MGNDYERLVVPVNRRELIFKLAQINFGHFTHKKVASEFD